LVSLEPPGPGTVVEIGSGGGFLKEFLPHLVTSEVLPCSGFDMTMDACGQWPFDDDQIKAVFMVDVFHHLPDVHRFLAQAAAKVRSGGIVAMVEPWVTPWSRLVYSRLHHEPFLPEAAGWAFPSSGPLSDANSALPWIVFERDREAFERDWPGWIMDPVDLMMPFSYLLSGGVSFRSFCPKALYALIRRLERWTGLERRAAMFARIVLRRL
jgi:hypothetical protein